MYIGERNDDGDVEGVEGDITDDEDDEHVTDWSMNDLSCNRLQARLIIILYTERSKPRWNTLLPNFVQPQLKPVNKVMVCCIRRLCCASLSCGAFDDLPYSIAKPDITHYSINASRDNLADGVQTAKEHIMAQTPQKRPARNVKTKTKSAAPAAKQPKAVKTNTHIEAGVDVGRYTGVSSFVNSNRPVKVLVGVTRTNLTDRAASGLYALRETYGNKTWNPRGFDNGILRDLVAMKLIQPTGGQTQTINGSSYLVDGAKPVQFALTAEGMAYGKA